MSSDSASSPHSSSTTDYRDMENTTANKLTNANQLYDQATTLFSNTEPLNEQKAKLLIELTDDALKEFGNTNAEKKVKLKEIRAVAESVLPPSTIDELKKRAEGQFLKNYPMNRVLQKILLTSIAIVIVAIPIAAFVRSLTSSINDVTAQNPFGEQEILLNGQTLLVQKTTLPAVQDDSKITDVKHLFQIDKPDKSQGFEYETLNAVDYARKFDSSEAERIEAFAVFRDATVFRVYRTSPFELRTTKNSYNGSKADHEKYREAWHYYMGSNDADLPPDLTKQLEGVEDEEPFYLFDELAVLIVDRHRFEQTLMARNHGRIIQATPLNFMLNAGGGLPTLDVLAIKSVSVSKNGRVWGFFGENEFHNVIIDGVPQDVVHYSFYRLYVINSAYVYQITLSYMPHPKHPRATWDTLVAELGSLRIAE